MFWSNICLQCELYHWVDVLDRFDKILSEACLNDQTTTDATQCIFMCPSLQDAKVCVEVWRVFDVG